MNWEKAVKEGKNNRYRFGESARDRDAYEVYMDNVRRAKAEMKGGSIAAGEAILKKQGEVDAQRKQYEYLKSIGALGGVFGVGDKRRDQTFEEYLAGLREDESMRREMLNRQAAQEYRDARNRYKNPFTARDVQTGTDDGTISFEGRRK